MFASPSFDIVSPAALLIAGGVFFAVFTISTVLIETLVVWILKWASFGRSLLAVFLMNLASTVLGFVLLAFTFLFSNFYVVFLVGFVLSVLIEGGILMLMKKGAARQNWIASLAANAASYAFLAIAVLVLDLL